MSTVPPAGREKAPERALGSLHSRCYTTADTLCCRSAPRGQFHRLARPTWHVCGKPAEPLPLSTPCHASSMHTATFRRAGQPLPLLQCGLPPPCRLAAPAALLPTLVFGCPCPWSSAGWQDAWQPAVYSRGGSRQRGAAASMQRVLAGGLGAGGGSGPQPSPGSTCQFRCPSLVGAPAQPRLAAAAEAHAAGASAGLSGRGAPACTFLGMPCRLPACMPSGLALQQQQLTWKG